MIICVVVANEPCLMRMHIFPFIFAFYQRLPFPNSPVNKISGCGKGIVSRRVFLITEEEHYIDIIDENDLRIATD